MITVICGHRGTGKSSLANRLSFYLSNLKIIDLDKLIEASEGRSISDIFEQNGVSYFRGLEQKYFQEIVKAHEVDTYVVVGGGFDISHLDKSIQVLWVRRDTDLNGRIFLNRPPLDKNLSPLDDYLSVFPDREAQFIRRSNEVYTMPEGLTQPTHIEKQTLVSQSSKGGFYTLLYGHTNLRWLDATYELRTDLLTKPEIESFLTHQRQFLFSFRAGNLTRDEYFDFTKHLSISHFDWALETGEPPPEFFRLPGQKIVSYHGTDAAKLKHLSSYESRAWLKWSPVCENFVDLADAIEWQKQDPSTRSLLPRSNNGRWTWTRLLLPQRMNFWRDGSGSASDQPTLYEWLERKGLPLVTKNFAAILGDPVKHSWSPQFHYEYFKTKDMPFFKIQIHPNEWDTALPILKELGLKAAAITSPLKKKFTTEANNTLVWDENKSQWRSFNTDIYGLRRWPLWIFSKSCALWGGDGVDILANGFTHGALPHYSSRTGDVKNGIATLNPPEVLIWAAPRTPETKVPPKNWPLRLIIDLNYTDNSMGKELALARNVEYVSGSGFFVEQALEQQKIWSQFL